VRREDDEVAKEEKLQTVLDRLKKWIGYAGRQEERERGALLTILLEDLNLFPGRPSSTTSPTAIN